MVSSVGSNSQNQYGSINKVGSSKDGRIIYQVVGTDGKVKGGLSVAPTDCDKFEHSYKSLMNAAPKVEKYMQTHTEADLKKQQKKGRRITGISAFTGGIIPAVFIRKPDNFWVQLLCTIAGAATGFFAGLKIAKRITVPPGAEEMSIASRELSKLDIKQI